MRNAAMAGQFDFRGTPPVRCSVCGRASDHDIDWRGEYQKAIQQATLAFAEKCRAEAELVRLRLELEQLKPAAPETKP